MKALLVPALAGCAAFALFFSCSKEGDDVASPAPTPATVTTGVVDTGLKTISGTVVLGNGNPAEGYELWTLDHTSGNFRRDLIGAAGTFAIPITYFVANDVYTMHVARDFVLVADIDMSAALPGEQLAFTYQNGIGYDVGKLTVPLDVRGTPGRSNGALQGRLAGGFGLANDNASNFNTIPTPFLASVVAAGSQLIVLDPATILHAFYRKDQNQRLYAEELASHARVGFRIASEYEDRFTRGSVLEAGDWLRSARVAGEADEPHGGASLWAQSNFTLTTRPDRKELLASVFSGGILSADTFVVLELTPKDGRAEIQVPRRIGAAVGMPPKLTAVSVSGAVPVALDYANDTVANGLTRPFCRKGDVAMTLEPPKDLSLAPFPAGTFDTLELTLDYFGIGNGVPLRLPAALADLPAEYAEAFEQESGVDSRLEWDPALLLYRVSFGTADLGAASHTLTLPAAIFVNAINTEAGAAGIYYIRVRATYRDSNGAAAGGVAIWIDGSC